MGQFPVGGFWGKVLVVDVGSGVLFWKTDLGPFGSGTVDSFLRIQDNDSDEQGYNTDAAPLTISIRIPIRSPTAASSGRQAIAATLNDAIIRPMSNLLPPSPRSTSVGRRGTRTPT